jgi:hypothetical protein
MVKFSSRKSGSPFQGQALVAGIRFERMSYSLEGYEPSELDRYSTPQSINNTVHFSITSVNKILAGPADPDTAPSDRQSDILPLNYEPYWQDVRDSNPR